MPEIKYVSQDNLNEFAQEMNQKQKTIFSAKSVSDQLVADVDTIGDALDQAFADIAVLDGRVDNITSLPAGSVSTSADAELVDIRVGADGTIYSTAGDAVRSQVGEIYLQSKLADLYGANASVAGTSAQNITATWDSTDKQLDVNIDTASSSATTYYTYLAPKLIAGHTYKIAVKYDFSFDWTYIYLRNIFSPSNYNTRDDIVNGSTIYDGAEDVYTCTPTSDGWLAIGVRLSANSVQNWSIKFALYDVTDKDVSGLTNADYLLFPNEIVVSSSGVLSTVKSKAEYSYDLLDNIKGEVWSALGDSLTGVGSGGLYLTYTANKLGLSEYNNCGVGGTSVSGAESANAMYQDARINALDLDSNCVTVLGGTNDIYQIYYDDHPGTNMTGWGDCERSNHDVSTFCGAYNVMISKILYKYCRVNGYYNDVDYTGIIQAQTAVDNFRLILMTPPQNFYTSSSLSEQTFNEAVSLVRDYVKQIAELWGLPCVDTWEMGMNDMNKSLFFANPVSDSTHFNSFGHERLASLLIDKAIQISRYK